jgi:hypothetical protein
LLLGDLRLREVGITARFIPGRRLLKPAKNGMAHDAPSQAIVARRAIGILGVILKSSEKNRAPGYLKGLGLQSRPSDQMRPATRSRPAVDAAANQMLNFPVT